MLISSRVAIICVGLIATITFAGCAGLPDRQTPSKINADEIAIVAEQIIVSGERAVVDVDCGDGVVPFEVGTVIPCTAIEEEQGEPFALNITIAFIQGSNFEIMIENDIPKLPAGPALP